MIFFQMMCRHIGFCLYVALRPWHGLFQYKALRDLKKKGLNTNEANCSNRYDPLHKMSNHCY